MNDLGGQVLMRREVNDDASYGALTEVSFALGGRVVGAASSTEIRRPDGPGPGVHADFGQGPASLSPSPAAAGTSVTVASGDTLRTLAQRVWGDANLWYKLAEANGLTGAETLSTGQVLRVPAGVVAQRYAADAVRPYDPTALLGGLSPADPAPAALASAATSASKHAGCGVLGQVLLAVVAVAVTVASQGTLAAFAGSTLGLGATGGAIVGGALAGAAGSVVSQGVGVATGLQDRFNWGAVALSGIAGGVSGGLGAVKGLASLGGSQALGGAVRGVLASTLTQGIGVATGLQGSFSWAGVAAAGVAGGVIGRLHLKGFTGRTAMATAGALAGAATKSVLEGTDFGDNVLAALPDVIGATIGEQVASRLVGGPSTVAAPSGPRYLVAPQDEYGNSIEEDVVVTGRRMTAWEKLQYDAGQLIDRVGTALTDGYRRYGAPAVRAVTRVLDRIDAVRAVVSAVGGTRAGDIYLAGKHAVLGTIAGDAVGVVSAITHPTRTLYGFAGAVDGVLRANVSDVTSYVRGRVDAFASADGVGRAGMVGGVLGHAAFTAVTFSPELEGASALRYAGKGVGNAGVDAAVRTGVARPLAEVGGGADGAPIVGPLRGGVNHEIERLAELGVPKNNTVWRPTQADMDSAAFKVIVGEPKFTPGGLPKGTIFDGTLGGNLEIKGGSSMLDSTYQLRLQTYRSLKTNTPLTIETTRPINPAFQNWLDQWGVSVARPK